MFSKLLLIGTVLLYLYTMAAAQAPNTLGAAVVAMAWVSGVFAIVVVAARFYVRMRIVRKLFRDDYIILITLVSTAG